MKINKDTVKAGDRLNYNDGRLAHRDIGATVLSVDVRGMLVQFDDRADTTRIDFDCPAWMDFLTLKNQ